MLVTLWYSYQGNAAIFRSCAKADPTQRVLIPDHSRHPTASFPNKTHLPSCCPSSTPHTRHSPRAGAPERLSLKEKGQGWGVCVETKIPGFSPRLPWEGHQNYSFMHLKAVEMNPSYIRKFNWAQGLFSTVREVMTNKGRQALRKDSA